MPYFLDKDLPYHVENYMRANEPPVNLDRMTEYLMMNFPHYANKKLRPFKESVSKAFEHVSRRNRILIDKTPKKMYNIPDVPVPPKQAEICANQTPKSTQKMRKNPTNKSEIDSAIESNLQNHLILEDFESTLVQIPLAEIKGIDTLNEDLNLISYLISVKQEKVFVLLSGPIGCGKSTLIYSLAKWLQMSVVRIDCEKLFQGDQLTSSPDRKLKKELVKADSQPNSVLHLDQLDFLTTKDVITGSNKHLTGILASYLSNLKMRGGTNGPLLVIGEVVHPELMDARLSEKFRERLSIPPPDSKQRSQILQGLVGNQIATDVCLQTEGKATVSYVAHDLCCLVEAAKKQAIKREMNDIFGPLIFKIEKPLFSDQPLNYLINSQDFKTARKLTTPGLKNKGFPSVPETTWADIGGLTEAREALRNVILDPILHPALYRLGGASTAGILLWGPPGNGKTLLAKAVANEAGINLLTVNGPSLLNMYQGESEREVRAVFAKAASVAPCVIFFDEFDSLCPKRSGSASQSGSKSTIVNTLLTEMDGFVSRPGIYIIAATNLPSILDPAVLRPGRLDTHLYVGHPDVQGRLAVFKAVTKNGRPKLASDVNLSELAQRTECEGFTGADCANLINRSVVEVWKERKTYLKSSRKRALLDPQTADQRAKCARTEVENGVEGSQNGTEHSGEAENGTECSSKPSENGTECSKLLQNGTGYSKISENGTGYSKISENGTGCSKPSENGAECSKPSENGTECAGESKNDEEFSEELILSPEKRQILFPDGLDCVYLRHIDLALSDLKPSISAKELKKYEEYKTQFGS